MLLSGPVVLFFYPAAMTKGCTKESCHFRDLAAEFAALGCTATRHLDGQRREAGGVHVEERPGLPAARRRRRHVAKLYGVKRSLDLLKVKRTTFVIGQDQRIVEVITSEVSMNTHADKSLDALRRLKA